MSEDRFDILQAGVTTGETAEGPTSKAEANRRVHREPELQVVTAKQLKTMSQRPAWPAAMDYVLGKNDELYKRLAKGIQGNDRA